MGKLGKTGLVSAELRAAAAFASNQAKTVSTGNKGPALPGRHNRKKKPKVKKVGGRTVIKMNQSASLPQK